MWMKMWMSVVALASAMPLLGALPALPDGLVYAKDGSGVYGYL